MSPLPFLTFAFLSILQCSFQCPCLQMGLGRRRVPDKLPDTLPVVFPRCPAQEPRVCRQVCMHLAAVPGQEVRCADPLYLIMETSKHDSYLFLQTSFSFRNRESTQACLLQSLIGENLHILCDLICHGSMWPFFCIKYTQFCVSCL